MSFVVTGCQFSVGSLASFFKDSQRDIFLFIAIALDAKLNVDFKNIYLVSFFLTIMLGCNFQL